jgi:hypothetical protein
VKRCCTLTYIVHPTDHATDLLCASLSDTEYFVMVRYSGSMASKKRHYAAVMLAIALHNIRCIQCAFSCTSDSSCNYTSCNKGCYINRYGSYTCYNYGCSSGSGRCWWCEPINGASTCCLSCSSQYSAPYWCTDPPACDEGTWSSTGYKPCSACSASSCLAGQYLFGCGGASSGACAPCPAGTYSVASGASVCSTCSTSRSSCVVGQYLSGCGGASAGICTTCQAGSDALLLGWFAYT